MTGFVPPPYPYDRLRRVVDLATASFGSVVDLSIGTPGDPPPEVVLEVLARSPELRGYPPSVGTADYRAAAAGWLRRRFGVEVDDASLAACVGTKELVVGLPRLLSLRTPDRDTVLHPEVAYPSYAMGAMLAGCRAVPVPLDESWRIDLSGVSEADASRALCLWVNTPGNPAGGLDDLTAAASWGRERGVPVVSDECYVEFTWAAPGRTILQDGTEGVLAVHSLSKRSNLAGGRAGFYAGDAELVRYLSEVRKHIGLMVPGPVQSAGAVAWADDEHVEVQRGRYRGRLETLAAGFAAAGLPVTLPEGGFYLWVRDGGGDGWALAERLATRAGVVASPGEFYGSASGGYVRLAVVRADEEITRVAERLASLSLEC